MKTEIESLEPYVEKIYELVTNHKLDLLQGYLSEDLHLPLINCDAESPEDVTKFIAQAAKLGSVLLILDSGKIDSDALENAISEIEDQGQDQGQDEGEDESDDTENPDHERLEALKKGRSKCGTTGLLRLSFISHKPSAVFQIVLETTLNALLYRNDSDDDGINDDDDSDDEPSLTEDEFEKLANNLASDEKFQAASKNSQRRLVAKRLFSEQLREDDLFPLDDLVENANAIFEVDLKPFKNKALTEKAEKLLESGLTKKEIAKKLGISTRKLSDII